MSRLTDRLYWQWRRMNGAATRSRPRSGGMGGVPPMDATQSPARPSDRVSPSLNSREAAARPEKPNSFISE